MFTCCECDRPINTATELCPYCGADLTEEALVPAGGLPKKRNLLLVLFRWGVLVAAIWAFLWYVLPERGDPSAQAETHAIELLEVGRAALVAYAEAQGGSFPPSLEALPAAAGGVAPVREAAQRALSGGYRLEYTPGQPNADGRVTSFTLRARAGHYGYRNFFTDQTGIIRATRENRPATPEDPPI